MSASAHTWTVYIDGASRNNPGKAGAGIFIQKNGETVCHEGFYLGIKTNNQAEYLALLLALFFIDKYADAQATVRIASDSELLVKQMAGLYKVKNGGLQPLYHLAQQLRSPYQIEILHVMRADNTIADALANKGIDSRKPMPQAFQQLLEKHHIT